jgi:hypothetical protein
MTDMEGFEGRVTVASVQALIAGIGSTTGVTHVAHHSFQPLSNDVRRFVESVYFPWRPRHPSERSCKGRPPYLAELSVFPVRAPLTVALKSG